MEQLRTVAPGLVTNLGGISQVPSTTPSTGTPAPTTPATGTPNPAAANPDLFSQFMSRMVSSMSQNNDPTQPPEERYRSQLEQLTAMGFVNREANLQGTVSINKINRNLRKNKCGNYINKQRVLKIRNLCFWDS